MKILVVSYDENNIRKTKKEIIEDVCDLFLKTDNMTREDMGKELRRDILSIISGNQDITVEFVDTIDLTKRCLLVDTINATNCDLLVTYNYAGFEQCTLTDGLAYNLVDCRQFHFVLKDFKYSEHILTKEKSINMFFCKCRI